MENEKKNSGILVGILIGLVISLLVVGCLFMIGTVSFSIKSGSNDKLNNNQDNINQNDNNDIIENNSSFILNNVNDYLGYWYQEERHTNIANSNNLNIKSISNNDILFDLYITRTTQINDIKINLDNGEGIFSKEGSEGDGKTYNGSIEINEDAIIVVFEDETISFKYHVVNFIVDNFKGEWHADYESSKFSNSNQVIIKSVDNNKVTMTFYIFRTVQTEEFDVYISNGEGIFDIDVKDFGHIHGIISFSKENYIKLTIGQTDVKDLQSGSSYIFKYKI